MTIQFDALPFSKQELAPTVSENMLNFHYDKHHFAYVQKANELLEDSYLQDKTLEEIVRITANDPAYQALFNNAGQVFNHNFYWKSLTSDKTQQKISDILTRKIDVDFGSLDNLKQALVDKGMAQFGSGWVWLVLEDGILKVVSTANANSPLATETQIPLLCIDVWEHAYYLDYQNKRMDYLKAVVDNCLNWQFASTNYDLI